jgi:hypothetical protein
VLARISLIKERQKVITRVKVLAPMLEAGQVSKDSHRFLAMR